METINRRKIGMLSKFWLTKQGELGKESCFEDFKKELRIVFPYILFHSLTLSDMKIYMSIERMENFVKGYIEMKWPISK